jgi:hypothetical protein
MFQLLRDRFRKTASIRSSVRPKIAGARESSVTVPAFFAVPQLSFAVVMLAQDSSRPRMNRSLHFDLRCRLCMYPLSLREYRTKAIRKILATIERVCNPVLTDRALNPRQYAKDITYAQRNGSLLRILKKHPRSAIYT